MKKFVLAHPGYEPAYLALWEKYVTMGETTPAALFFDSLKSNPVSAKYGWWLDAKLKRLSSEPRPNEVLSAYQNALSNGAPTPRMIYELSDFLYEKGKYIDSTLALENIPSKHGLRNLARAFLHIQKENYIAANRLFEDLPSVVSTSAEVQRVWGYSCYQLGKRVKDGSVIDTAGIIWQKGLEKATAESDEYYKIAFLTHLAALAKKKGNYVTATKQYLEAFAIADSIQDLRRQTIIFSGLSDLLADQDEYHSSLDKLEKAIGISKKLQDKEYLAKYYGKKAFILEKTGQFAEAFATFKDSETLSRETRDVSRLVDVYLRRGDLYSKLNYHKQARENYESAHELLKTAQEDVSQYLLRTEARLGHSDMAQGNYFSARKKYQNYVDFLKKQGIYQQKAALWTIKVAETYEKTNEMNEALVRYREAKSLADSVGWRGGKNQCVIRIANINLQKKDTKKAIELLTQPLDSMDVNVRWEANFILGKSWQQFDRPLKASAAFRRAIEDIENFQGNIETTRLSVLFFSGRAKVYDYLVESYYRLFQDTQSDVYLDSLVHFAELGRGRSLRELTLNKTRPKTLTEEARRQQAAYHKQGKKLRGLQRQLRETAAENDHPEAWESLETQWRLTRNSLVAQHLLLSGKSRSAKTAKTVDPPTLSEIKTYCEQTNRSLLMYHLSERQSFAFLASKKKNIIIGLDEVNLPEMKEDVHKLMREFHLIGQQDFRDIPFYANIAHRLYLQLIKPLETAADLSDELLIIPHSALVDLPFEMLLTRQPAQAVYTPTDPANHYSDDFLQHRYTISYSPNISLVLAPPSTKKWFGGKLLIFANSFQKNKDKDAFRGGEFWRPSFLSYAKAEAISIAESHPKTQTYLDNMATKLPFFQEAKKYLILHLSTHGFVDKEFDVFSGLVFSLEADSSDDGYLMGYELIDQKLANDLIVLSACETGRGKVVAGEGVLGLPRLFIAAGAKSVVMTHWKINDRFSSILMPEFYQQLFNESLPKAEALAQAKRNMLHWKNENQAYYYQHPAFWACFALFGDPGEISGGLYTSGLWPTLFFLMAALFVVYWMYHVRRKKKVLKKINVL